MAPQHSSTLNGLLRDVHRKRNWPLTLLVAVWASIGYTAFVLGYALLPFTDVHRAYILWQTIGFLGLMSLGTIGFPIVLFSRYRLLSPVMFLLVVILFWHLAVHVMSIAALNGTTPTFLFVFLLAPVYVIIYGCLASIEFWARTGRSI